MALGERLDAVARIDAARGGVAALYAARHPERGARLILLCPIPPRHFDYGGGKTAEELRARTDPGVARMRRDPCACPHEWPDNVTKVLN